MCFKALLVSVSNFKSVEVVVVTGIERKAGVIQVITYLLLLIIH